MLTSGVLLCALCGRRTSVAWKEWRWTAKGSTCTAVSRNDFAPHAAAAAAAGSSGPVTVLKQKWKCAAADHQTETLKALLPGPGSWAIPKHTGKGVCVTSVGSGLQMTA
jgi:hypothetical protein